MVRFNTSPPKAYLLIQAADEEEEDDEDNMDQIDLDNIIPDGRRTRGRNINWAKAAEEFPEEDEDEDEDDDFEAPGDEDKMEE